MLVGLFSALLTSRAHADLGAEVHAGGGLEGGTITRAPRPDGVAEAGALVEVLLPGRNWGFGARIDSVGRYTNIGARSESRVDVTWRYARPDRRVRVGVGIGVRSLQLDDRTIRGADLVHLDGAFTIARWSITPALTAGIDVYLAWTTGCYRGEVTEPRVGDMRPATRTVACTDTLTTTYTGGIATSVRWR